MKVNIETKKIKDILPNLQKNTNKNINIETSNILYIKTAQNSLILRVASTETCLEWEVECKTIKEGFFCVNLEHFYTIINSIDEENMSLESEEFLTVYTSKTTSKLTQISIDIFPEIPELEDVQKISIINKNLLLGLHNVRHSISREINKPEFSGVFIYNKAEKLYFVSTDVKRLSEYSLPFTNKEQVSLIVPDSAIQKLLPVLQQTEEVLVIDITDNSLIIRGKSFTFFSRLINGTFPNYKQLFPSKNLTQIKIQKKDIETFLRKGSVFSDKHNTIIFQIIENELKLSFKNEVIGETEDVLEIENDSKEKHTIYFNYTYIHDCVKVINDEKILISFSRDTNIYTPVLFTGSSNQELFSLVVPLQISQN